MINNCGMVSNYVPIKRSDAERVVRYSNGFTKPEEFSFGGSVASAATCCGFFGGLKVGWYGLKNGWKKITTENFNFLGEFEKAKNTTITRKSFRKQWIHRAYKINKAA